MAFEGKVSIVTGGSSGIGKATVELLASLGSKVAILDTNTSDGENLAEELNRKYATGNVVFYKCNVVDKSSFRECFEAAKRQFKSINYLINNAGRGSESLKDWQDVVDVNLKGVINGSILAVEYIGKKSGSSGGAVVNVASILAFATMPFMPVYVASKAAVVSFTRSMATDGLVDIHGLKFVCICPSATNTPILSKVRPLFDEPGLQEGIQNLILKSGKQKPESVAKSIVEAIERGENGGVWIVRKDEPASRVTFDVRLDDEAPTVEVSTRDGEDNK